jgi:protein translocase SecG subunit
MDLVNILKYAIVVIGAVLTVLVLLQSRSGGLGTVFGGGGGGGEFYRSKRGAEAVLYNGTIILGILFCILAIGIAILSA